MKVPSFDDLPMNEALGMRHAWGVFGEHDELGTLNHAGPAERAKAASLIRSGRLFNLSLPLTEPSPPLFRRKELEHHIIPLGRNEQDDYVDSFYLQRSSQWDGLRHIAAREFGFYNGVPHEAVGEPGAGKLGIERFVEHGMMGRGVLLDVAGYLESQGTPIEPTSGFEITVDHLEATRRAAGIEYEDGDFLLIRTGWMAGFLAADADGRKQFGRRFAFPGLYAGEATARYLWETHCAAVAADNPALEVAPGSREAGSLHRRILPLLGMAIGELLTFEDLAADCRADGRYEAFLAAVPLYLPGGVASPANAVALK